MAFTITHTLIPIVVVDYIRDHFFSKKHKKLITHKHLFVAGLSGALVDLDVFLIWAWNWLNNQTLTLHHRVIFHNVFIPIFFLFLGYYFWKKKKKNLSMFMFMIFAGVSLHLLIDIITWGSVWLVYPLSTFDFALHILDPFGLSFVYMAMIDAAIFLAWLWHEEKHHYIRNYF